MSKKTLFEHIGENQFKLNEMAKFQAKFIPVSGGAYIISPRNGKDFSLEELVDYIGGGAYIQIITPPGITGAIMAIDEEGKMKDLPINQ